MLVALIGLETSRDDVAPAGGGDAGDCGWPAAADAGAGWADEDDSVAELWMKQIWYGNATDACLTLSSKWIWV